MKLKAITLILCFLFLTGSSKEKQIKSLCSSKIYYLPISFSRTRKKLTIQYKKERYDLNENHVYITPRVIVVHWTACSFKSTYNYFNREVSYYKRYKKRWYKRKGKWRYFYKKYWIRERAPNVSTQFVVNRDGKIYQLMSDNWMARHCIGLNYCSIGIENVGSHKKPLTDAQLCANIKLITMLKKKYPTIEYMIGHCEYRKFENHPFWKEKTNKRTYKIDPGKRFMKLLRYYLEDLNLRGAPYNSDQKSTCYSDIKKN